MGVSPMDSRARRPCQNGVPHPLLSLAGREGEQRVGDGIAL